MDNEIVVNLHSKLDLWGDSNLREFPWRFNSDPYCVLVSEFMLHRTQAKQVEQVYTNFIHQFPDLQTVSHAPDSRIKKVLEPLGLSWRIDTMVAGLKEIYKKHGSIPLSKTDLLKIHGIGDYIAGAVVCFILNKPIPLIDTNTVRVTGRVFGLDLSGEARRRKEIVEAIEFVIKNHSDPRRYYYSIIDLAHLICNPKAPDCWNCPLLELPCHYGNTQVENTKRT